MDTRLLLLHLEHPLAAYSGNASVAQVVMAELGYPVSDYWPSLAIEWLEQGAAVDPEILLALVRVSETKHFSQRLRHRSQKILRRATRSASSADLNAAFPKT